MGFMDSYKRLEKLCRDAYREEKPIKAYIELMKKIPNGSHYVRGWKEDLDRLKHYHWVRNQISHEPGCTEQNMCSFEDAQWLDDFYRRMLRQEDPLALYRKVTQPRKAPVNNNYQEIKQPGKKQNRSSNDFIVIGILMLAAVILLLLVVAGMIWGRLL